MYFLAVVIPPLAVLLAGKPFQFLLNVILTLFFWVPGMIHAIMVVSEYKADQRNRELVKAVSEGKRND
ncbi:YqaE/Pmp3 family membrane protein [Gimesia panareensis]|uniref:Proteolipid membrane potential modulator n=1 Tax=Gimesia panareensis TaxID=2527978 RepID=A0A518FN75_9PLAN|nr:YqaE/Pmp3 family membrane protein [Gimesia panareensis]QDT26094.1 Proteolipid membrane potential modulator [Gimesia panareensis]QDU49030.1 Proteolipid membrane potential modulator [Gimesia panareensis]QDV17804.1 Proteolipid membrane potential modulator [Gimesia panareensis]